MFQKNTIKYRLFLATIISFFFCLPLKVLAAAPQPWPDLGNAIFDTMLKKIDKDIEGAIMGALKQAAAEMMDTTVSNLISGGGAGLEGALFIQDWDDELFYKPIEKTEVMMENFFKSKYKGRSADYAAVGQATGGLNKNYYTYLQELSRNTLELNQKKGENLAGSKKAPTVYDYCKDPFNFFGQENMMCWVANSGSVMGNILEDQKKAMSIVEQEMKKVEIQAVAYQGFKAQKAGGGQVMTPGSTIKDIQGATLDLGNKILAGATSLPEVITSLVTKITVKAIKQGIGNAQRNIQREIINPSNRVRSDIEKQIKKDPTKVFNPKY